MEVQVLSLMKLGTLQQIGIDNIIFQRYQPLHVSNYKDKSHTKLNSFKSAGLTSSSHYMDKTIITNTASKTFVMKAVNIRLLLRVMMIADTCTKQANVPQSKKMGHVSQKREQNIG